MKALVNWLDHRTGMRGLVRAALFEHIPGGARWRYVWGSTLVFAFVVQAITGIVLWAAYSPSAQTAWESVYYIQHEMWGGWLVRGIHHFMAQAMIVLLALHLMQIVIDGAYRAPREFNFWIGMILALLVLAMSLTGYLLPWDQKGYWATKVATNLAGATPLIGPQVQQVVVGGNDYGHHTLTRFFALHAGLLPALIVFLVVVHVALFRRHGLHARKPYRKPDAYFWPEQILRDSVACLAVLAVVVGLCIWKGFSQGFDDPSHLGASLYAPADPSSEFSAARPEWYFLFLFQLLKLLPLMIGAFVVPGILVALFFVMPLNGCCKAGHYFNVGLLLATLIGATVLTVMAINADDNPEHKAAVALAQQDAERVVVLAHGQGIPPEGAVTLLRDDPKTRGPRLFAQYCSSCHRYDSHNGMGMTLDGDPTAADLHEFATKEWLDGLFDPEQIVSHDYFGGTKWVARADDPETPQDESRKASDMIRYVTKDVPALRDFPEDAKSLDAVIWMIANEADLPQERELMKEHAAQIKRGKEVLMENFAINCLDCHKYGDEGSAKGPQLKGYRSEQWIINIITNPAHVGYKRTIKNEAGEDVPNPMYPMPAFGTTQQLDKQSIELLAKWLRGEWYEAGEATEQSADPAPMIAEDDKDGGDKDGDKTAAKDSDKSATKNGDAKSPTPAIELPNVVPDKVDFATHVKPILEARCVTCHGSTKPKGKFEMTTRDLAFTPGSSDETPIVAGKPGESYLVELITEPDPDFRMPPADDGVALTQAQIDILVKWIEQGAEWPEGVTLKAKEE